MIDSGRLKAVLDIFQDYCLQMCKSKTPVGNDGPVQQFMAQALIEVLKSKFSSTDIHIRLYAFRALSVICKANQALSRQYIGDILELLKQAL